MWRATADAYALIMNDIVKGVTNRAGNSHHPKDYRCLLIIFSHHLTSFRCSLLGYLKITCYGRKHIKNNHTVFPVFWNCMVYSLW